MTRVASFPRIGELWVNPRGAGQLTAGTLKLLGELMRDKPPGSPMAQNPCKSDEADARTRTGDPFITSLA